MGGLHFAHPSSSDGHVLQNYKIFSKITLKAAWQIVYLLSLDSACKLLNLLQLLWSLQHVRHMLRSLNTNKGSIKYPVFQLSFQAGSRVRIRINLGARSGSEFRSNFRNFRGSNWSHGRAWTLTMLSHKETQTAASA